MNDTPETDTAISDGVEMLTNQSDSVALYQKLCDAVCEIQSLRRERDEAREENAKLREIAERAINYLDQSYRNGFCDEASDLRAELDQVKEGAK